MPLTPVTPRPRTGIAVAQLGARMHYAIPRILSEVGLLSRFFCDFSVSDSFRRILERIPAPLQTAGLRRLAGRSIPGIPPNRITAFNRFGLEYAWRLRRARSPADRSAAFLWAGREFCRRVLANGLGDADAVYCFNTAGLEVVASARQAGLKTILEQTIAPCRLERELLAEEHARFPGWEPEDEADASELIEREEAEWEQADMILCGSEFVRAGIGRTGGPVEKCLVVPYGVQSPPVSQTASKTSTPLATKTSPLRVLTVGSVSLRKGSPYVLEAARCLSRRAEFRMVGPINVSRSAAAELRAHLQLTGPIPRADMAAHWRWADVFLLPSICEGSATACYEALAHGLPVICTPNTGSVVRDRVDGFVVPVRDVPGIVERLARLAANRDLLGRLRRDALLRAREYTCEAYGRRLLDAIGRVDASRSRQIAASAKCL